MTRTIPDRRPYAKRKRLQLEAGRRRAESHSCCMLKGIEILWITAFFMVWSSIAIVILSANPHSPSTAVLGNYHEISHLDANEAESRRLMESEPQYPPLPPTAKPSRKRNQPTTPSNAALPEAIHTLSATTVQSVKELQEWYDNGEVVDGEEARGLEDKVDSAWMDEYPEIDRPASPVARNQGQEPICWMYSAATLLRTKQEVLTPHRELVDKIKEIKWDLLLFLKDFQSRYRADRVDGMKCWMESKWRKLTESPVMKKLFPVDWRDRMLEGQMTESWVNDNGMAQRLMLQYFWNLYGFSYAETIYWRPNQDTWENQEPKIKDMLQHERALISLPSKSWDTLMEALHTAWFKGGHSMVLDRFDAKTGEYIVKNSQGRDGKIHIPEEVFSQLEYYVYFIKERHSTHTPTLEKNGWMRAVAILSQTKQDTQNPLPVIVAEIKEQWYTFLAFSAEKKRVELDVGRWSPHQKVYWQRTGWWDFDFGKSREGNIDVAAKFYGSKGLQLSKGLEPMAGEEHIITMKKQLRESEGPSALILIGNPDWQTIVSQFTTFYQINDDGSDAGEPQLMILQEFVQDAKGKGTYMLQDTHGLNEGNIIQIPEEVLHRLICIVWFVDYQTISSPHTFGAKGEQSSDRKDVYRVYFIDPKTEQQKWFAINVMKEIENIGQNEIRQGEFDVYIGEKTSQSQGRIALNLKSIKQPLGLEIQWDTTDMKRVRDEHLSPDTVESVLKELGLMDCAETFAAEKYEFRDLPEAEPEDLISIGLTPEQACRLVTHFRPSHKCASLPA